MPLIFNGSAVNLNKDSRETRFIKQKVEFLRKEYSEDGKKVHIIWDHSQLKRPYMPHSRVDRSGREVRVMDKMHPRGVNLPMFTDAQLWPDEGSTEVVYVRRMPAMLDGKPLDIPREKEMFTGKITVDMDKQPDLAFFYYYSPFCRDGGNSNGSNIFKFRHKAKEDQVRLDQMRLIASIQDYVLNDETNGGLSLEQVMAIGKMVKIMRPESMTESALRMNVTNRVSNSSDVRRLLAIIEEMVEEEVVEVEVEKQEAEPVKKRTGRPPGSTVKRKRAKAKRKVTPKQQEEQPPDVENQQEDQPSVEAEPEETE